MEVYSGSDYITVNTNNIINRPSYISEIGGGTSGDENQDAILINTNIPGLFYFPVDLTAGGFPPVMKHKSEEYKNIRGRLAGFPVINNKFRGIPPDTVVSYSPIQFVYTDADEPSGGHQKGQLIVNFIAPIKAMDFKLAASCQYTFSDNGNVDFGDQRVSQITDDRNTTIKRSLTLNMDKCYGVNKVKTYITTTAPTAESGLLLGNNIADGAKNVAVALRVNKDYNESGQAGDNAGKDMYFDNSNPMEWNFGNAYTVTPLSKHIPLDVWLMRNGGEPTPGDYHATATIMMDFI
ncbi:hypothetical protein GM30_11655 [Trabulsiella odontotermitis]|nr:hypothetical protein GM30_11655 [Trabulsiella odontotermitis]